VVSFTSVGAKDSLRNVLATASSSSACRRSSWSSRSTPPGTDYPPEVSEFDAVGLRREPSRG
jgi:hypothetical protein